jgi:hypothetical protein
MEDEVALKPSLMKSNLFSKNNLVTFQLGNRKRGGESFRAGDATGTYRTLYSKAESRRITEVRLPTSRRVGKPLHEASARVKVL